MHTPGPWRTGTENWFNILADLSDGPRLVAAVYCPNPMPVMPDEPTRLMWQANARLIAAAPDVLHALERLLGEFSRLAEQMHGKHGEEEAEAQAKAAIAKAKGEPSC